MSKLSKLEKMAKKDAKRLHAEILARSEDKLQAYLEASFSAKHTQYKMTKKFAFVAASILIVVATLVTSIVIWWQKSNNGEGGNTNGGNEVGYYQEENEVEAHSAPELLNAELQLTQINVDEEKSKVYLIYDSLSKDHLYFKVQFDDEDSLESATVLVAVNANYHGGFESPVDPKTATVNGFTVKYTEGFEFIEDFGFYSVKATAEIITAKEHIFITYEAYCLEESSNFLSWLEQVVIAK